MKRGQAGTPHRAVPSQCRLASDNCPRLTTGHLFSCSSAPAVPPLPSALRPRASRYLPTTGCRNQAPEALMRHLALAAALAIVAIDPAHAPVTTAPPGRPDSAFARAPRRGFLPTSSRADSLRGAIDSPGRRWWDVTFYDLHVTVSPTDSSIVGYNGITYRVTQPAAEMQIDLMEPLVVDSMIDQRGRAVRFRREGAAFFATLPSPPRVGDVGRITVHYHGRPRIATNPPWEGVI